MFKFFPLRKLSTCMADWIVFFYALKILFKSTVILKKKNACVTNTNVQNMMFHRQISQTHISVISSTFPWNVLSV